MNVRTLTIRTMKLVYVHFGGEIMGLRNRYKHLKRLREIVNTLTKYGLGQLVALVGLEQGFGWRRLSEDMQTSTPVTSAERLRKALEDLGPAFIKLGQLLSIRSDILPPEFTAQLEKLQDEVQGVAFEKIAAILEKELGEAPARMFQEINPCPLASASIGQVHYAKLWSGEEVVIKVQRPGVKAKVEVDLEILLDLAKMVEARTKWGKFYKVVDLAEEFIRAIRDEIDYTIEGRNADFLRKNFQGDSSVKIPQVYWQYSSKSVLVMEFVRGIKINQLAKLKQAGCNPNLLAHNLANAVFKQIYVHGFFHGDPHPGNLAVTGQDVIVFMDFGMVGRLDDELKDMLASLAIAIVRKDTETMVEQLIMIGDAQRQVNKAKLRRDIQSLMFRYYDLPLDQLSLGDILQEMLTMAYKYRIRVPEEITMLAKTLVTLEGIVRQLDPSISIVALAEPFGKYLVKQKYAPERIQKRLYRQLSQINGMAWRLPHKLDDLLSQLEKGELVLELDHKYFQDYLQQLNQMSNRLTFSIVIAALIIGSSLIAQRKQMWLLWKFPIAEVGFILAVILGLWLIFSILMSRKL